MDKTILKQLNCGQLFLEEFFLKLNTHKEVYLSEVTIQTIGQKLDSNWVTRKS